MSRLAQSSMLALVLLIPGCAHRAPAGAGGAPASGSADVRTGAAGGGTGGKATADSLSGPYGALGRARAAAARVTPKSGRREAPDSRMEWSAWSDRDTVFLIRESVEVPLSGVHVNDYAFEHGRLAVFVSRGEHALTGGPDERGAFHMRIAYGADGRVMASEKFVNERPQALETFEPPAALARADWLRALIRQDSTAAR